MELSRSQGWSGVLRIAKINLYLFYQGGKHRFFGKARLRVTTNIDGAVSRDNDHGNFRVCSVDMFGQFQPIHAIHAKVGNEKVKLFSLKLVQRVLRAVSGHGTKALHLENLAAQACQYLMVIHKENRFHSVPSVNLKPM